MNVNYEKSGQTEVVSETCFKVFHTRIYWTRVWYKNPRLNNYFIKKILGLRRSKKERLWQGGIWTSVKVIQTV